MTTYTRERVRRKKDGSYSEELGYDKEAYLARKERKAQPKQFIAVDGEGKDTPDGRHIYTLLAASTGDYIENQNGLTWKECLPFLLSLGEGNKNVAIVGFFFNYDSNMILTGLPTKYKKDLATKDVTIIPYDGAKCYKVEWIQGKWFKVWKGIVTIDDNLETVWIKDKAKGVCVYDAKGFFQTSFYNTLLQWGIGTEEERELIHTMKAQRESFDIEDPAKVRHYNAMECRLLVQVMEKLDEALTKAGIAVSGYHGAGAIAGALLKKFHVKEHIEDPPEEASKAVLRAYFGGRIQVLQLGLHDGAYSHDVNSAYPSVLVNLPSLKGASWRRIRRFHPSAQYALYRVRWKLPANTPITPFPYRKKSLIYYPYEGEGYYWQDEVRIALKHFGPEAIQVVSGWEVIPATDVKPFGFITELYELRKAYKKAGDLTHIVIKLGLNSLYGKTAENTDYKGRRPAYQSMVWAGMITSGTRAKLLDVAMSNPTSVISFATDGVYSTEQLTEDTRELGGWETGKLESFFVIQPGVYLYKEPGKEPKAKVRGFRPSEVNFNEVIDEWKAKGVYGRVVFKTRRFIGLKIALAAPKAYKWQAWPEATKVLEFYPTRGVPEGDEWLGVEVKPVIRVLPPEPRAGLSEPFKANYQDPVIGVENMEEDQKIDNFDG